MRIKRFNENAQSDTDIHVQYIVDSMNDFISTSIRYGYICDDEKEFIEDIGELSKFNYHDVKHVFKCYELGIDNKISHSQVDKFYPIKTLFDEYDDLNQAFEVLKSGLSLYDNLKACFYPWENGFIDILIWDIDTKISMDPFGVENKSKEDEKN